MRWSQIMSKPVSTTSFLRDHNKRQAIAIAKKLEWQKEQQQQHSAIAIYTLALR